MRRSRLGRSTSLVARRGVRSSVRPPTTCRPPTPCVLPEFPGLNWDTMRHVSSPLPPLPLRLFFFLRLFFSELALRSPSFGVPLPSLANLLVGVPYAPYDACSYSVDCVDCVVYDVYDVYDVLARCTATLPRITLRSRSLSLTATRFDSHIPSTKSSRSSGLTFQLFPPGNVLTMSSSTLRNPDLVYLFLATASVNPFSSCIYESICFANSFTIRFTKSANSFNEPPTNVDAYATVSRWGYATGGTSFPRPLFCTSCCTVSTCACSIRYHFSSCEW